ncbi:MAG TPA: ferritin-like domain-containing protein [Thermoleophilaceae bacterium]|jgi:rubrerythrin
MGRTDTTTRRTLLGAAVAGAALAGCGDDSGGAPRRPNNASDAATLNSLLAFEHAVVAAYDVSEPLLRGRALRNVRAIADQEREHVRLLTGLVRDLGATPAGPRLPDEYRRSFPRMRDEHDALFFASDLEERGVRKYLESLAKLSDPRLRRTAGALGVDEGEHLAVVHLLRGEPAAPEPFVTGTS